MNSFRETITNWFYGYTDISESSEVLQKALLAKPELKCLGDTCKSLIPCVCDDWSYLAKVEEYEIHQLRKIIADSHIWVEKARVANEKSKEATRKAKEAKDNYFGELIEKAKKLIEKTTEAIEKSKEAAKKAVEANKQIAKINQNKLIRVEVQIKYRTALIKKQDMEEKARVVELAAIWETAKKETDDKFSI